MNQIPEFAEYIINILVSNGYQAYLVGGCVRDTILKHDVHDIDITTSALPDTVIKLFDDTEYTGKKYGTVSVYKDGNKAEVTTFRNEYGYSDYRRPDKVIFTSNLKDDVKRRDFTINAICMDSNNIIDYFNGINDIKTNTIRCIGNPDDRFKEDPLRIIRAFRFSSTLGFSIEPNTFNSAIKNSNLLKELSVERIRDELYKIAITGNISILSSLLDVGALEFLGLKYDERILNKYCFHDVFTYFILFLYFCGKDSINKIKLSNSDKNLISQIFDILANFPNSTKESIKRVLSSHSFDAYKYACLIYKELNKCDMSDYSQKYQEIIDNDEPYLINHLKINGNDLLNIGICEKEIGNTLKEIQLIVINNPDLNSKQKLLKIALSDKYNTAKN